MQDHVNKSNDQSSNPSVTEQNAIEQLPSQSSPYLLQRVAAGDPTLPLSSLKPTQILYLQRTLGNRALTQMVQRVPGATTPEAAAPEAAAVDVTGSYSIIDPDGNNRITMQLNQAGNYIQGWYQKRVYREHTNAHQHQSIHQHTIEANLESDENGVLVYNYTKSNSAGRQVSNGTMTFRNTNSGVRLTMSASTGWRRDFEQTGTDARISDEALENLSGEDTDVLESAIVAPLDAMDEAWLEDRITEIKSKIRDYLDESGGMERSSASTRINAYLEETFVAYASEQLPMIEHRIRTSLNATTYTHQDTTHTYWNWLQTVVSADANYTRDIQQRFDITPSDVSTTHKYRYMVMVGGLAGDIGVGAGAFVGVLSIEKLEPDQWRHDYTISFGQVSGGLSVGVTSGMLLPWTEFESFAPWEAQNFEGTFFMGGLGAAATLGAGGGYSPVGGLSFHGDGTYDTLAVPTASAVGVAGAAAGIELSAAFGYITDLQDTNRGAPESGTEGEGVQPPALEGTAPVDASAVSHFAVDDPALTDEGRQALREMCAENAAAFQNEASRLEIDGYTSTTGGARNEQLSDLRAANTLQFIRDILGDDFRIQQDNIRAEGHGEGPAREAGLPDNTESQEWRRVNIRLNGNLVLSLQ